METPALDHLMGAYLHQDYDLTGTIDDNIMAFVRETPDLAPRLPAEVAWALETFTTEAEMETFVLGLGCQVLPPQDAGGYRGWLADISSMVRSELSNA